MSEQTSTAPAKPRELTGRHVLMITLGAFAVILAANMAMVIAATSSFPGLVAKNSYVASQDFNRKTAALEALGWTSAVGYANGEIVATMTDAEGAPVRGLGLTATVGRPSDMRSDTVLALTPDGDRYVAAPVALEDGLWRVALSWTDADGERHQTVAKLFVSSAAR